MVLLMAVVIMEIKVVAHMYLGIGKLVALHHQTQMEV
jgi:hypothetical protein